MYALRTKTQLEFSEEVRRAVYLMENATKGVPLTPEQHDYVKNIVGMVGSLNGHLAQAVYPFVAYMKKNKIGYRKEDADWIGAIEYVSDVKRAYKARTKKSKKKSK